MPICNILYARLLNFAMILNYKNEIAMSADIHSDGLDTNRKKAQQLDDRLTELTLVLKAIGVEELNMEDDQHYHLLNEEKKADAQTLQTFSRLVQEMYNEIVARKPQKKG